MHEELGVFVTLNKHNNLRGCIGYPEPVYPLIDAVIDSAISAAMRDPRFPSVDESELDSLDYEITVLILPRIALATSGSRTQYGQRRVPIPHLHEGRT